MCCLTLQPVVFSCHSLVNALLARQPPLEGVNQVPGRQPVSEPSPEPRLAGSELSCSLQVLLTGQGALQRPSRLVFTDVANAINA